MVTRLHTINPCAGMAQAPAQLRDRPSKIARQLVLAPTVYPLHGPMHRPDWHRTLTPARAWVANRAASMATSIGALLACGPRPPHVGRGPSPRAIFLLAPELVLNSFRLGSSRRGYPRSTRCVLAPAHQPSRALRVHIEDTLKELEEPS